MKAECVGAELVAGRKTPTTLRGIEPPGRYAPAAMRVATSSTATASARPLFHAASAR